jgi:hypothetical protein
MLYLCTGFQHANLVGSMSVPYNLDFVQGKFISVVHVVCMYSDL